MKLPLHLANGQGSFYLCDANGRYVAKSLGDSEDARADLVALMNAMNDWEEVFCQRTKPPSLADRVNPESSHYDPDA